MDFLNIEKTKINEKQKKKGFISLKKYLERNRDEYDELNVETRSDKDKIEYNRRYKGMELKILTKNVNKALEFGKKRRSKKKSSIDSDIIYLNSI